MTLIEAVKELQAGKCEMISRASWDKNCGSFQYRDNGHGTLTNRHGSGPVHIQNIMADDWILVGVKRREEVRLVRGGLELPGELNSMSLGPVKFYAEWIE